MRFSINKDKEICGAKIRAIWTEDILPINNGLILMRNDKWAVSKYNVFTLDIGNKLHSKEGLCNMYKSLIPAFKLIYEGLQPEWFNKICSCGAHALYGKNWEKHPSTCQINETYFTLPDIPKNNDNRTTCFICGEATKIVSNYCICKNKSCKWFNK